MSARLAHRGPDGESRVLQGPVGFAYQMMRILPESLSEVQPLAEPAGGLLMWDGRLDNREELLDELGNDANALRRAPDAALVFAAYRTFGDEFARRLDGDFALALYDPARMRLLLARDLMGGRPLYYCRFGNHFLFSSEIKALLLHPAVQTGPDEQTIAEWAYRTPDYSADKGTFFQNISMVVPGELVVATPFSLDRRPVRDFDVFTELRLKSYEEYVEAYRAQFERAVRCRLRNAFPVAIAVSGGLDSSSNYCVAQDLNRRHPVEARSLIGLCLSSLDPETNETAYQQEIERQLGVELLRIPLVSGDYVDDRLPVDLAYLSEGPFLRWHIWSEFARLFTDRGARTLISGYFGDHLLTNPQYLLDLIARGRALAAFSHLKQYFEWWEVVPPRDAVEALWVSLKGYLVPERVRPSYQRIQWRLGARKLPVIPWYSDHFNATAAQVSRHGRIMKVPATRAHAKILYQHAHSRYLGLRGDMEHKIDGEIPFETAYPFRDRALIQLIMSMPGEVVYRSGARGIHRDAMKGVLPEKVRLRRTKANFDEPTRRGSSHDLDALWDWLPKGTASRLGYLAREPQLGEALSALRAAIPVSPFAGASWRTSDLIALEAWMSAFFCGKTR